MHLRNDNFQGQRVLVNQVPTNMEAVTAYENLGGSLTAFPTFGIDPLAKNAELQATREQRFSHETNVDTIFGDLVNSNSTSFKQAIQRYANIAIQLGFIPSDFPLIFCFLSFCFSKYNLYTHDLSQFILFSLLL